MSYTKPTGRNTSFWSGPATGTGFLLRISYGQSVRAEEHGSFVIM